LLDLSICFARFVVLFFETLSLYHDKILTSTISIWISFNFEIRMGKECVNFGVFSYILGLIFRGFEVQIRLYQMSVRIPSTPRVLANTWRRK